MKIHKNKVRRYIFLLLALSLVLVIYFRFSKIPNTESQPVNKEKPNSISCTRTTRLDNLPQYDRALSLIQQRLVVNLRKFKYNNRAIFTSFPPELTNCIKVVEEESTQLNDFEGYFKFNGSDIKSDYYPIVVNSKYVESDDVLIALLLTHEITHVQQYLDSINNIKSFSCVDGEVEAFLASRRFYITGLNDEENRSVRNRIDEALDNNKTGWSLKYPNPFDGQLIMLDVIQNLYSSPDSKCNIDYKGSSESFFKELGPQLECVDAEVPVLLKKIIEEDDYYKKQCDLK